MSNNQKNKFEVKDDVSNVFSSKDSSRSHVRMFTPHGPIFKNDSGTRKQENVPGNWEEVADLSDDSSKQNENISTRDWSKEITSARRLQVLKGLHGSIKKLLAIDKKDYEIVDKAVRAFNEGKKDKMKERDRKKIVDSALKVEKELNQIEKYLKEIGGSYENFDDSFIDQQSEALDPKNQKLLNTKILIREIKRDPQGNSNIDFFKQKKELIDKIIKNIGNLSNGAEEVQQPIAPSESPTIATSQNDKSNQNSKNSSFILSTNKIIYDSSRYSKNSNSSSESKSNTAESVVPTEKSGAASSLETPVILKREISTQPQVENKKRQEILVQNLEKVAFKKISGNLPKISEQMDNIRATYLTNRSVIDSLLLKIKNKDVETKPEKLDRKAYDILVSLQEMINTIGARLESIGGSYDKLDDAYIDGIKSQISSRTEGSKAKNDELVLHCENIKDNIKFILNMRKSIGGIKVDEAELSPLSPLDLKVHKLNKIDNSLSSVSEVEKDSKEDKIARENESRNKKVIAEIKKSVEEIEQSKEGILGYVRTLDNQDHSAISEILKDVLPAGDVYKKLELKNIDDAIKIIGNIKNVKNLNNIREAIGEKIEELEQSSTLPESEGRLKLLHVLDLVFKEQSGYAILDNLQQEWKKSGRKLDKNYAAVSIEVDGKYVAVTDQVAINKGISSGVPFRMQEQIQQDLTNHGLPAAQKYGTDTVTAVVNAQAKPPSGFLNDVEKILESFHKLGVKVHVGVRSLEKTGEPNEKELKATGGTFFTEKISEGVKKIVPITKAEAEGHLARIPKHLGGVVKYAFDAAPTAEVRLALQNSLRKAGVEFPKEFNLDQPLDNRLILSSIFRKPDSPITVAEQKEFYQKELNRLLGIRDRIAQDPTLFSSEASEKFRQRGFLVLEVINKGIIYQAGNSLKYGGSVDRTSGPHTRCIIMIGNKPTEITESKKLGDGKNKESFDYPRKGVKVLGVNVTYDELKATSINALIATIADTQKELRNAAIDSRHTIQIHFCGDNGPSKADVYRIVQFKKQYSSYQDLTVQYHYTDPPTTREIKNQGQKSLIVNSGIEERAVKLEIPGVGSLWTENF